MAIVPQSYCKSIFGHTQALCPIVTFIYKWIKVHDKTKTVNMRREYRLFREQKLKLFTQYEAELLSGFSRRQLRTLEEAELVVPHRYSLILYDWNQLIFLKVLHNLRQDWSFRKIESALNLIPPPDLEEKISRIHDSTFCVLLSDDETGTIIEFFGYPRYKNDLINHGFKKKLNTSLSDDVKEEINKMILSASTSSKTSIRKQTIVIIPDVIDELKTLAQEKQIENFDLKVG